MLKPTLDLLSDRDWINQTIVYFYKDYTIKPDIFSLTVRHSESLEELQATRDSVTKEISFLRSNPGRWTVALLSHCLRSLHSLQANKAQ